MDSVDKILCCSNKKNCKSSANKVTFLIHRTLEVKEVHPNTTTLSHLWPTEAFFPKPWIYHDLCISWDQHFMSSSRVSLAFTSTLLELILIPLPYSPLDCRVHSFMFLSLFFFEPLVYLSCGHGTDDRRINIAIMMQCNEHVCLLFHFYRCVLV